MDKLIGKKVEEILPDEWDFCPLRISASVSRQKNQWRSIIIHHLPTPWLSSSATLWKLLYLHLSHDRSQEVLKKELRKVVNKERPNNLTCRKVVSNAFDGNDLYGRIFFQIIPKLGDVNIQVSGIEK
jgi:hypothetical protein